MSSSGSSSDDESDPGDRITADAGLSASTLAALQQHLAASRGAETSSQDKSALPTEDFGMSQFWYDEPTQDVLASELLRQAGERGKIAILSAPSVMGGLARAGALQREGVHIFEYDRRFAEAFPAHFVFYDYNSPEAVPEELKGACDVVLSDPPYLGEECCQAFFETMKLLEKSGAEGNASFLFITSPRNEEFLRSQMKLRKTAFELRFQSKFATPMALYINYESEQLTLASDTGF